MSVPMPICNTMRFSAMQHPLFAHSLAMGWQSCQIWPAWKGSYPSSCVWGTPDHILKIFKIVVAFELATSFRFASRKQDCPDVRRLPVSRRWTGRSIGLPRAVVSHGIATHLSSG
jgi:hypothetical protein